MRDVRVDVQRLLCERLPQRVALGTSRQDDAAHMRLVPLARGSVRGLQSLQHVGAALVTTLLAAMLALLAILDPATVRLARTVAGESGSCPLAAQIAVAHVASRNSRMYGDAEPTAESLWVAIHWREIEDTSKGALFILSDEDLKLDSVQAMIGAHIATWVCDHDYRLHAYARRD